MKAKLTKRFIENLAAEGSRDLWVWDTELPSFGVRVKPSGVKAYVLQYRNMRRQSRKITIGRRGVLTLEEARRVARQNLAAIERGEDPANDRQEQRDGLSVTDLARRFDEEHIAVRVKPITQYLYRLLLRRFILPVIGKLRIVDKPVVSELFWARARLSGGEVMGCTSRRRRLSGNILLAPIHLHR